MKKPLLLILTLIYSSFLFADTIPDNQLKVGADYVSANAMPGYRMYIEYSRRLSDRIDLTFSYNHVHSWRYMSEAYLKEQGLTQDQPSSLTGSGWDLMIFYNILRKTKHRLRTGAGLSFQRSSTVFARPFGWKDPPHIVYTYRGYERVTLVMSLEYEYSVTPRWSTAIRGTFNLGYVDGSDMIGLNLGYKF